MGKMSAVAKAASVGPGFGADEHMSMTLRSISNGYILSHSRTKEDGSHEHVETYHEKKPDLEHALRKAARGKVRST